MKEKNKRGPSEASKAAERYLGRNPGTPAADLAKKFKVALTTIYRAPWWKNQNKGESKK